MRFHEIVDLKTDTCRSHTSTHYCFTLEGVSPPASFHYGCIHMWERGLTMANSDANQLKSMRKSVCVCVCEICLCIYSIPLHPLHACLLRLKHCANINQLLPNINKIFCIFPILDRYEEMKIPIRCLFSVLEYIYNVQCKEL